MSEQEAQLAGRPGGVNDTLPLQPGARTAGITPEFGSQLHKAPGWGLWLKWALASAILGLSPVVGILLVWVTGQATFTEQGLKVQVEAFWGSVIAFLAGCMWVAFVSAVAQGAVLHPYSPDLSGKEWVRTIIVGYLLAALLYVGSLIVAGAIEYVLAGFFVFASGGKSTGQEELTNTFTTTGYTIIGSVLLIAGVGASAIIGLAQRVALRRYLPNARRLIVSNILAALIFQLSVVLIGFAITGEVAILHDTVWNTVLLGWFATLFLSGTITGFTLVRLLRRPIQTI